MDTLLVNLYGAPCSGKSVKMMQLTVAAKIRGVYCEMCAEVAKEYVVQHIRIDRDVQWEITREQVRRLSCFVGNVEAVVTDAPVQIGGFYARYHGYAGFGEMERDFDSLASKMKMRASRVVNVYMWRDHPYVEAGRLESEGEDAEIARRMWEYTREKHAGEIILEARSTENPDVLWDRVLSATRS